MSWLSTILYDKACNSIETLEIKLIYSDSRLDRSNDTWVDLRLVVSVAPYRFWRREKSWIRSFNSSVQLFIHLSATSPPFTHSLNTSLQTITMVKLTEVEDEHFAQEKPQASKHNVLLTSDDEGDYTDTG